MRAYLQSCCTIIPQRYILVLMCFFALYNAFAMRMCLSIVITEMVQPIDKAESNSTDTTCAYEDVQLPTINANKTTHNWKETYDWDEYTQGLILSSFYWVYGIVHIPGGTIANKYGGKYTLGIGILLTAVFTILTPTAVYNGNSTALIILRVLMGMGEGVTYPAINVLLAQWTPPEERSRTATFVYIGATIGTICGITVSGWILEYSAIGWPLVFYVLGMSGILWFVVWVFTCYNSPREHPYITQKEVDYLKIRMNTKEKPSSVPWRHILTSKALWALITLKIGFSWTVFTLSSDLPKYMSNVLKFSVANNGYLNSLIYLSTFFSSIMSSWLADHLVSTNRISNTMMRKIGAIPALMASAGFIVGASYAGCDRVLVVVIFIVAMSLIGFAYPSIIVNSLDLSPNYAGHTMALANGIASLTGIAGPYVVGILTPNQLLMEWRVVFWTFFGVSLFCNIVFLLFGSGEAENWNDPEFTKKKISEKKRKSVDNGNA